MNELINIKKKLKSEFVRNVITLFSGTALAQLIPITITPILTRLYTPSDYGVLAVFLAITSLIAVASTLRYDIAILMPSDDHAAKTIMLLSIFCVLSIAILLMIVIFISHNRIAELIGMPSIAPWLYSIPLSIVFVGCSSSLNYWLNRHKEFRKLAINRVTVAVVASVATLVFGFYGFGYSGLILSILISQLTALAMLVLWTWRDMLDGLLSTKWALISQSAKEHRKFPLFSLPSDWINSLSQQLPALMLNKFFGAAVVGHFSFSQKTLGMPVSLMSQSISDVFKQRASSDYSKTGNCKGIFNKTSKMLAAISVVPLVIIFLFAPAIFRIIFGAEWEQAGVYTRYLAPLYIFRFIVSPLSYVFYIANRQDADLIGQVGILFVSVGSMLLGKVMNSPAVAILSFSIGYILAYLYYYYGAYNLAKGGNRVFS